MHTIIKFLYKNLLRPILFKFDPESIHRLFVEVGSVLGSFNITRKFTRRFFYYGDSMLEQKILGIEFKNPIGLGGGYDKNGETSSIMPDVGFGFMEIGSITNNPSKGNARPRIWRLPQSKALVVHYGLMNDGVKKIRTRIENKKFRIPLLINIAKTNDKTLTGDKGINDYVECFEQIKDLGDIIVINISCPNVSHETAHMDAKTLDKLLTKIDKEKAEKPILLKIASDLTPHDIDEMLAVTNKHKISGFIVANLAKSWERIPVIKDEIKPEMKGGISGKPAENLSNILIQEIYKKTRGKYIIIGSGGVFTAEDAYLKIKLGANLIEVITGMIYEGPQMVGDINRGIKKLLKRDGLKNIKQAVGTGVK
ncbi:MAG: protein PyrD, dihydroorotate dehydrogenase (fumarate) [Candidatus Peregrinibacteria bacterium GW2011_GWC2_39_14]|nr:MAG: Dihydroorotate dehydrogenase 2 [Candidatus Peregrinibacteria bacterium GW2011_GWA2_38_36]KKR04752.1 MAG: protein PyrD, dihydroorotate dehydrogenase (fumarate) [Candidatus Peregrinibacteria bacterium GW2011_GWC2_39_14]